uniref:Uncharacterized protein n=1 Tax=Arundo donax TaxID=35708 RepID=A0A0A8XVG8_ARUDO
MARWRRGSRSRSRGRRMSRLLS